MTAPLPDVDIDDDCPLFVGRPVSGHYMTRDGNTASATFIEKHPYPTSEPYFMGFIVGTPRKRYWNADGSSRPSNMVSMGDDSAKACRSRDLISLIERRLNASEEESAQRDQIAALEARVAELS